jgi:hypothetical protein
VRTIDAQPEGEPASVEAPIVAGLASKTAAVEVIVNREILACREYSRSDV